MILLHVKMLDLMLLFTMMFHMMLHMMLPHIIMLHIMILHMMMLHVMVLHIMTLHMMMPHMTMLHMMMLHVMTVVLKWLLACAQMPSYSHLIYALLTALLLMMMFHMMMPLMIMLHMVDTSCRRSNDFLLAYHLHTSHCFATTANECTTALMHCSLHFVCGMCSTCVFSAHIFFRLYFIFFM